MSLTKITKISVIFLALNLPFLSLAQLADEDDILIYMPAIIAANAPKKICTIDDLFRLRNNTTGLIDCNLDLESSTVTLSPGVTLQRSLGNISNGTLVFNGGKIDGEILNSSITVIGNPELIDPVFKFYPERWASLVQGPTNADTAFANNQELERLFFMIKRFAGHTFVIDRFDAYFEGRKTPPDRFVFRVEKEAVNIPSDFSLIMSNRTHLRVFPAYPGGELVGGSILAVRDEQNILVKGGNLHGDRDQRFYSPDDTGAEGSHLFTVRAGRNITLDGIKFFEGSKGSISIHSFGFFSRPESYNPSKDIIVKNCLFRDSRRMSIALTDGQNILIKDNTFINTGLPSTNSDGGEVGYAVNIEPGRRRRPDGTLEELQKVFNARITGNLERGSRSGFVTLTIGQNLTVDDNDVGTRVVSSLVSESKIINNRFSSPPSGGSDFAIFAAGGTSDTVFDNEVAGNTISGYDSGIITSTTDVFVHDNIINNTKVGIQINKTFDSIFSNNTINSSSRGINVTNTFNNNVTVNNNTINSSAGFLVYLANINKSEEQSNYTMTFSDNELLGNRAVVVSNLNGIDLLRNDIQGGVEMSNLKRVRLLENIIASDQRDGVRLFGTHVGVNVSDNTISLPTGGSRYECIDNNSETPAGLILLRNSCN